METGLRVGQEVRWKSRNVYSSSLIFSFPVSLTLFPLLLTCHCLLLFLNGNREDGVKVMDLFICFILILRELLIFLMERKNSLSLQFLWGKLGKIDTINDWETNHAKCSHSCLTWIQMHLVLNGSRIPPLLCYRCYKWCVCVCVCSQLLVDTVGVCVECLDEWLSVL